MANVLVLAEVAEGKLKKPTHSAVTFARQAAAALGGTYTILVIGEGLSGAAADAALKVQYVKFEAPPARKAGIKVKDVADLVNKLKNEAKVL